MARIEKILHIEKKDKHALVYVMMNDGLEACVYVGGECETYLHKGRVNAFVKKSKSTIDTES